MDRITLAERLGAVLLGGAVAKQNELRLLAVEPDQDFVLAGVVERTGKNQSLPQRIAEAGDEVEEPALRERDDRVAGARVPSQIVQDFGDRLLFRGSQPQSTHSGFEADDAPVGVDLVQLVEEEAAEEQKEKGQTPAEGEGSGQPGRQYVE